MKTKHIFRLAALAAACSALTWGTACTEDPETTTEARLDVSTTTVSVTKRGVDRNGNDAYIRINSNVYWTASYPEDDRTWLTLSAMAGDPGTTTLTLGFTPNEEVAERRSTIRLETFDGTCREIAVIQRGTGEVIVLMNDGFAGDYNEGTPIARYIPSSTEGIDAERITYDGTEAFISMENPSYGYEGASGGNNVLLKGSDAALVMTGVDAVRDQRFDISFGIHAAEAFGTQDFALEISRDQEKWSNVPYTISQTDAAAVRAEVAGWQMALASFRIAEPVEEFFVRLRAVADRNFRIDDLTVEEGTDAGEEIPFPGNGDDPAPIPGKVYLEENFDWITSDWGGSDYFDGSKPTTEVAIVGKLAAQYQAEWDSHGFSSVSGKAYCRVGYIKIGTTTVAGDIVTPRLAEVPAGSDLTLTFKAVSYNSSESDNTLRVNVLGSGEADLRTLTVTNASYPQGASTREERANWQEFSVRITGAGPDTQIQLQAASASKCRFFFDDFKIAGAGEPVQAVEGLPAVWSFSPTAPDEGLVKVNEKFELEEYVMLSDDKAARLEPVLAVAAQKPGTYKWGEKISDALGYNNRFLMYSFALDDYWLFTVPVKHFKAGTELRLQTELSASNAGPKFYTIEYSTDKTTWTAVNTRSEEFGSTSGSVAAHTIVYTCMIPYAAAANEACAVDEKFAVAADIEDGELYVRLRVCDALSNKLDKNIVAGNGGTSRIRRSVDAQGNFLSPATRIALASDDDPAPAPTLSLGGLTGSGLDFAADETEAKRFTVVSTGADWTLASGIDTWADVTPRSGKAGETVTVTVTPKAANTGAAKSGELTITAGSAVRSVTVTQAAFVAAMEFGGLTGNAFAFQANSTLGKTFTVTANVAWTATTEADWFEFAPAAGTAGETTVTVTPKSVYTGDTSRSGTIVFTGEGLRDKQVTVTQSAVQEEHAPGYVFFSDDFDYLTTEWDDAYPKYGWPSDKQGTSKYNEYAVPEQSKFYAEKQWTTVDPDKRIYARYEGHVKLGNGSYTGSMTTPALAGITAGAAALVKVSFYGACYATAAGNTNDRKSITLTVEGGGTINGATEKVVEMDNHFCWKKYWVYVAGATSQTTIRFGTVEKTAGRVNVDNVVIEKADGTTTQAGSEAVATVAELEMDTTPIAVAAGGKVTLTLRSNVAYTIASDKDWLTPSPASVNAKGLPVAVSLSASAEAPAGESAVVRVTAGDRTGEVTVTVSAAE